MSEPSENETVVEVQVIETPVEKPMVKDKQPLTYRLSAAQLRNVELCVVRPVEATQAQFPARTGDKNNEGKARRRPNHNRSTVMNGQSTSVPEVPEVPKSNGTPAEAPADKKEGAVLTAIRNTASVPYGQAAIKGVVFGGAAVATGAAVWFGGKWVVGKIKGSPSEG